MGAGQVPALSFTDTTSTSRSLRSWLATSTPVGGVPAVAPPVGAPVADFSAAFSLPMISTRLPTKAFRSPSLSPESSKALPSAVVPGGASRRRGVARQRRVDQHELIARSDARPDRATLGEVVRLAVVVFSLYAANQSDLLFRGLRGGLLSRRLSRCRRRRLRRLSRTSERTRPFPKLQWSQAPRLRILVSFVPPSLRVKASPTNLQRSDRVQPDGPSSLGFSRDGLCERTAISAGHSEGRDKLFRTWSAIGTWIRHQPQRSDGVARERNVRIS